MSVSLIELNRKTSSPETLVAIRADKITHIKKTKGSTTIEIDGISYGASTVIVSENYSDVLTMWRAALANDEMAKLTNTI